MVATGSNLPGAPGRLQRVGDRSQRGGEVYVDYAHTPDGLHTVLEALRPHVRRRRLIVVFGAGGDPRPGQAPADGPRGLGTGRHLPSSPTTTHAPKIPAAIRRRSIGRLPQDALEVGDRRAAIRAAVEQLGEGDVLVVAGKGHEQGQTAADVVHPFDDVGRGAPPPCSCQAVHA